MASSEFRQNVSDSAPSSAERWRGTGREAGRGSQGAVKLGMASDAVTVLAATVIATLYKLHTGSVAGAEGLWNATLIRSRSMGILLALLCGFIFSLVATSRRMNLYFPTRLNSYLHEQRLSAQACFTSGLLLTGALYIIRADEIPRTIVLVTLGLVTIAVGLRRLIYRLLMYRRFDRGLETRNVFIVGTEYEGQALRRHLDSIRHLGYTFKGFIEFPGSKRDFAVGAGDVVGSLETLFQNARQQFVDEIFFTTPCERGTMKGVLAQARAYGIDVRVVPEMYGSLGWNTPIEYIGHFPTIPLYRGHAPEVGLVLKRALDILLSSVALIVLAPVLLAIAIAVKLDSPGPVFYFSERFAKKGRVFRCVKFRTMVRDAEMRRADVLHMNQRDGVLFKISNDPRVTRLGRFLRKYSLDELPQFFNVLRGDMSVVGPRPPLASEVREYKLDHLHRLDVTPGITGLWQVQARQNPSFDSYISLDVAYIDNWTIWLDLKIIVRTIGVVFAGTGS
ncbi:MAG: sugar transferase [Acidobacteriota bacterium]